jgi:hypothetical protein
MVACDTTPRVTSVLETVRCWYAQRGVWVASGWRHHVDGEELPRQDTRARPEEEGADRQSAVTCRMHAAMRAGGNACRRHCVRHCARLHCRACAAWRLRCATVMVLECCGCMAVAIFNRGIRVLWLQHLPLQTRGLNTATVVGRSAQPAPPRPIFITASAAHACS